MSTSSLDKQYNFYEGMLINFYFKAFEIKDVPKKYILIRPIKSIPEGAIARICFPLPKAELCMLIDTLINKLSDSTEDSEIDITPAFGICYRNNGQRPRPITAQLVTDYLLENVFDIVKDDNNTVLLQYKEDVYTS